MTCTNPLITNFKAAIITKGDEEKLEDTDDDRQFSLSSKSKFDLPVEKEFSTLQSPEESVSPLQEISEISPVQESLDIKDMAISVGRSPSDFQFDSEIDRRPMKHDSSTDEGFSSKHGTLEGSTELKEDEIEEEKAADTTGDSLLEDEVSTKQFAQVEKIITKEEHMEKTVATTQSQIKELVISKDTSGPVPELIVEQKTFTTHDKDIHSKLTIKEGESTITTKETITEELDFDEEGNERKKEKKELISSLEHKTDVKEDEIDTKTSAKREDLKETIYPFGRESSEKHMLDTVASKEEVLETTVHAITETDICQDDTMKQKISREFQVINEDEVLIPGSEETEEDKTVSKVTTVTETGDLKTDMTKHDAIREVLFDVKLDDTSGKPIIEPAAERFGEMSEHLTSDKTFHSKETDKQEFTESHSTVADKEKEEIEAGHEYGSRGHRDSGHFEAESSEGESEEEAERSERLQSMAFDNMGFDEAGFTCEGAKQKQYADQSQKGAGYLSPASKQSPKMAISPDDLNERHTRFDFAEELKQEMYDSGHLVRGHEDDKTVSLSETESTHEMAGMPLEVKDIPADEGDKHIGEDKKSLQELDGQELEGAVGPAVPTISEVLAFLGEESSSSTSESPDNEEMDIQTGHRIPWEIASQYKRQFSDSFVEQEHLKENVSTASLDMGMFYRRDSDKDSDVTFLQDQKKGSGSSSDEVSPTTKKKMQKVRFSLSEEHQFDTDNFADIVDECAHVHSYDLKMNEEWLKSDEQESIEQKVVDKKVMGEPHEKITEAYHQAVMASIESRLHDEMSRKHEIEDFEEMEERPTEVIPTTSVKVTSPEAVELYSKGKDVVCDQKEIDEEDAEVDAVFHYSPKPLSVVSRESRLAHEELLRESFDEKDRSISPSIDSEELSTTYESQKELQEELDLSLLAGKSYPLIQQDESSETDRDTAEEERLSPIEEISGGEATDDTGTADGEKSSDKKVTFQTDMQHLCSVSSEELVKTSTSSSEVEPTLLAASYDLDSGRVSHVVTTYDLSPDTVEKQFLPVGTTSKAILSSPEDDVFEADITVTSAADSVIGASGVNEETPTEGDVELLPRDEPEKSMPARRCDSGSTGSATVPSPPAPSPFEIQQTKDTTKSDLEVAALKMQKLQTSSSTEKPDFTLELSSAAAVSSITQRDKFDLLEEELSPFEIMSPSELEGYEVWLETQKLLCEQDKNEPEISGSFVEIEKESISLHKTHVPEPLVPSAPPIPSLLSPDESTKDSSFEHSSPVSSEPSEKGLESPFDIQQQDAISHQLDTSAVPTVYPSAPPSETAHVDRADLVLPNGPTEVEYNPEIDLDFSIIQAQQQQESGRQQTDIFTASQTGSSIVTESIEPTPDSNEPVGSGVGSHQTEITESIMEDLQVQPTGDILVVSDQTLYGLEMPSDEAASLTTSHVDSYGRVEESDSLNVSVIRSIHDDTSEQIDSHEALGQIMGIDKTDEDISERPSEHVQEIEESPVTHSSKHTFESATLREEDDSSHDLVMVEVEPIPVPEIQTISPEIIPEELDSERMTIEATPLPHDIEQYGEGDLELEEHPDVQELEEQEAEEAVGGDDGYIPDEPKGTDDELDEDEELIVLKDNSDYDIDAKLEDFGIERALESAGSFELKADSCDLDRPLTPTPVDKKQGFFDDKFALDLDSKTVESTDYENNIRSYPRKTQESLIEQTASKFVETVLEEVKSKVKSKAALEVDEDIAIIQSPSSETGGDFTEMPDELPFDEPSIEVTESEFASKVSEDEIQKPVHLTKSSEPLVLIKQFSEEIPEVTLSQHLNESDEDGTVEKVDIADGETAVETFIQKEDYRSTEADVCVPELDDDDLAVEEAIIPSKCPDVSKSVPKYKDHTDHGKVCVPELGDDDDIDSAIKEPMIESEVALRQDHQPSSEVEKHPADGDKIKVVEEPVLQDEFILKQCHPPLQEILIIELETIDKEQSERKIPLEVAEDITIEQILETECQPPIPEFEIVLHDTLERKPPDNQYLSEELSVDGQKAQEVHPFLVKGSDFGASSDKEQKLAVLKQSDEELKSEQKLFSSEQIEKQAHVEEGDIFLDAQSSHEAESKHIRSEHIERKLSKEESEEELSEEINKGYISSDIDDTGDSSSVDSFTTVVAADEEDEEDEDRLEDFASLTSSIHSDIQSGVSIEDEPEQEPMKDPLQELIAWAKDKQAQEMFERKDSIEDEEILQEEEKKGDVFDVKGIIPFPWIKDEEDIESLEGSDRYDYVDRTALSVITELSEEDRFEIIEKDELESESTGTGSDSRHYSSPDYPPPSPITGLKFFSKSGEKDDISVSSSLLEFERLEQEINEKSSSENIEKGSSLGGSLDESNFLSKSLEKDDASISSSLADFERLERVCNQGSSDSSIEKIISPVVISPPEKSSISGSATSLSEFERLEKECLLSEEARRSSVESYGQKSATSVTSSQASLCEFERLEQELVIAEKLEAEAQKIVDILESGSLLPDKYSSEPELSQSESLGTTREILMIKDSIPKIKDDIDKDSIDGKDDMEDDSLSDNKKKTRGDVPDDTDSLDGEHSEMTTSLNSMILSCDSQIKLGREFDADSLHDSSEGAMKVSTDSLGERLSAPRSDKEKSETDSLQDQEGVMDKSADSLELNQEQKSESAEKVDSDSLGHEDAMQSSGDSLESYQIEAKHNVMEVSMESTDWSSASSMFSRSSLETMKSADRDLKSDSGHSKDVMEASLESWDEYPDDDEETDNYYIISKYQTSLRQAAESDSKFSSAKTEYIDPYLDYEGNYEMDNFAFMGGSKIPWDENVQIEDKSKQSPYLSKGKYEETKKIWSMTEWEAMKKARKDQAEIVAKEVTPTEGKVVKETADGVETEIVKSGRTITQVVNTATNETETVTKTTETISKSGETDITVEKDTVTSKSKDSQSSKLSETLTGELSSKEVTKGIG